MRNNIWPESYAKMSTQIDLSSKRTQIGQSITFIENNLKGFHLSHYNALVVAMMMANLDGNHIFIDIRSLANILFWGPCK